MGSAFDTEERVKQDATTMELSLDLCLAYVPKTVTEFLRDVSAVRDSSAKTERLEDFVSRLEDEMRKIDAFKRELPLCMLLLNDAIVRLKEEAMQCTDSRNRAVMEEFLPLKGNSGEGDEEKKWMNPDLIWGRADSDSSCAIKKQVSVSELNLKIEEEEDRCATVKPIRPCSNYGNRGGGGFVPFKVTVSEDKEVSQVPALCLATPMPELGTCDDGGGRAGSGSGSPVFADKLKLQSKPQPQASRKQRRCWSPELHRRFVDALQQLGGWKVATPKQIRELMQVDDLTNDEVKSHLQKYRLHIRKLPGSLTSPENVSCGDHLEELNNSRSQSGSPQGPLFGGMSAKGISSTGDESLEAEEDDKSECHSWRGGLNNNIHNHNHSHQPGEVKV